MKNKGFTLVELLAVIAILAILVIIAIPNVLKMFNDSKKNAFMVQARKTANVAQEHTVLSSDKTFDCNSLLTGQKFKDCTATVDKNNQVSVDVLGSGAYENFLMVDVTPNANSGTFVDLSKLNTINIGEEKEFKESLIKNNKINEPTFKQMTADEYVSLGSKFNTLTDEDKQKYKDEYNTSLNNIKIENNLIKSTSKETPFAATMKLPAGKYKIVYKLNDYRTEPILITDNCINNRENIKENNDMFNYLYFTDYNFIKDENGNPILTGTINISKDTEYYIVGEINSNKIGPEITIERMIPDFSINGDENITLMSVEVSSYKDAGVSYKDKTLAGNDVYIYTNLKDKEGEYKYIYVVKTNQGVKVLRRYITVVNYTSEKCFKFNKETQEIKQYYYFENNVSGGKKCPMDVVIPEKISGVQVKGIGHSAFEYDCGSDNIVLPTTSFNKYNIKQMAACSRPIGINSVILPEGLEYIGYNAFEGNNLKTVTIPSTVTEIHMYAFGSNQLQSVIFKGDRGKIKMCKSFKGEKHSDTVNAIEDTYCD
jgi:prepilin-type N-terminal cleavage/methylation domain-containing protein